MAERDAPVGLRPRDRSRVEDDEDDTKPSGLPAKLDSVTREHQPLTTRPPGRTRAVVTALVASALLVTGAGWTVRQTAQRDHREALATAATARVSSATCVTSMIAGQQAFATAAQATSKLAGAVIATMPTSSVNVLADEVGEAQDLARADLTLCGQSKTAASVCTQSAMVLLQLMDTQAEEVKALRTISKAVAAKDSTAAQHEIDRVTQLRSDVSAKIAAVDVPGCRQAAGLNVSR